MIGVEINYKTTYDTFLCKLLNGINFEDYSWNIIDQEIIYEGNENNRLNPKLRGQEFQNVICNLGIYFINFLNLQVFPIKSNANRIYDYDEFFKSDCSLIILIIDNNFIEIYFKNNILKEIVLKNLDKNNIHYIEKTKNNDSRVNFII